MRKYLTASRLVNGSPMADAPSRDGLLRWRRTVVHLLQRNNGVLREAALRLLVKQKGLWSHCTRLRRWHGGVVVVGIHDRTAEGEGVAAREADRMRDAMRPPDGLLSQTSIWSEA